MIAPTPVNHPRKTALAVFGKRTPVSKMRNFLGEHGQVVCSTEKAASAASPLRHGDSGNAPSAACA